MWILLALSALQCLLLSAGQVLLKFALQKMLPFGWTRAFWTSVFANWEFAACGLCFGAGSLLWMHILKHYPLSQAYPLVSLSYVISMFCAILFFNESVSAVRWIGCALIVCGCLLIVK